MGFADLRGHRQKKADRRDAKEIAHMMRSPLRKPWGESTESGEACGYDAGKKVKSRKNRIVTGILGLTDGALVYAVDIQDRDEASDMLNAIHARWPSLSHIFANGDYAGDRLQAALAGRGR